MAQLLVLSPDTSVLDAAKRCLLTLGHAPLVARSCGEAQRALLRLEAELICLDSIVPSREAGELLCWLADLRGRQPPVLLLAPPVANSLPAALPAFFQPHRDAVVTKPLESEALAREVARLLSARPRQREGPALIQVGEVVLDCSTHRLLFGSGGAVSLTPTEYRLLRRLMQCPGEFISPDELLEQVWGYPPGTGGPELVRAHVSNVRRKLREAGADPQLLRNIPYQGYSLVPG